MNEDFEQDVGRKLKYLSFFIFLIMAMYTYRLFSMQIIRGEQFRRRSQDISQRATVIPAQRGEIFDRSADIPMVLNTDSFAVDIVPGQVPKEEFSTLITRLSAILKIPSSLIQKKTAA